MNEKREYLYKHPILPFPYLWVLTALSILFIFVKWGIIGIVIIWFYRFIYFIYTPIWWEKNKQQREKIIKQNIEQGKYYSGVDQGDLIKTYGVKTGTELYRQSTANSYLNLEARKKQVINYRSLYINKIVFKDTQLWDNAYDLLNMITAYPEKYFKSGTYLVNSHIVKITKSHAEKIFGCKRPQNMELEAQTKIINQLPFSTMENNIANDITMFDSITGQLITEKIPQDLLCEYNQLVLYVINYLKPDNTSLTLIEKEKIFNTLKEFVERKDIAIFGLNIENYKMNLN